MTRRFFRLYLGANKRIWRRLPDFLKNSSTGRNYGRHLHALVCRYSRRNQNHSTFFMRNRPEMELMCRLLGRRSLGAPVSMTILACSKGAEVYSILWSVRTSRPDLKLDVQAVDIAQEVVDFAKEGAYSLKGLEDLRDRNHSTMSEEEKLTWATCRDQGHDERASIFQRLEKSEMEAMFERRGGEARIKSWLKEGVTWRVGDASAPELVHSLGTQDVVVANRFLCHMEPAAAEKCLRNIARLVKPGGFIFVSGVDLDVRTKVAKEMGWKPVGELMREVHEGDFSLPMGWPLGWWGLEPFTQDHSDWRIRYASVFQAPGENPEEARRNLVPGLARQINGLHRRQARIAGNQG